MAQRDTAGKEDVQRARGVRVGSVGALPTSPMQRVPRPDQRRPVRVGVCCLSLSQSLESAVEACDDRSVGPPQSSERRQGHLSRRGPDVWGA